MEKYEIVKGLPVPPIKGKYPWRLLEVGDSFFVVDDACAAQLSASASQAGKRLHKKFATRGVDGGVRVWRIK